jgi:hypothetical protein
MRYSKNNYTIENEDSKSFLVEGFMVYLYLMSLFYGEEGLKCNIALIDNFNEKKIFDIYILMLMENISDISINERKISLIYVLMLMEI